MRDLEQCKAEVFRRSEEKIKKRARQRRRALTLCVPLVLCLVVGAIAWPALSDSVKMGNASAFMPPAADEMAPKGEKSFEMPPEPEQATSRIDDAAAWELLRSLAPAGDAALPAGDDETEPRKNANYASESERGAEAVSFSLVTPEGEKTYTLSGGLLTCESEGWRRLLTEEEETALRQVMGLPEEGSSSSERS